MKTYVSKPVEVEAVRLSAKNRKEVCDWVVKYRFNGAWYYESNGESELYVRTCDPNDSYSKCAQSGDWIVRTPNGYEVLSDEEFNQKYEVKI